MLNKEADALDVKTVLTKAKAIIATPGRWGQGFYRNHSHTCFCGLGALATAMVCEYQGVDPETADLQAVMSGETVGWVGGTVAGKLLASVVGVDPLHEGFQVFNDVEGRTHAEIMEAFDKAIASV